VQDDVEIVGADDESGDAFAAYYADENKVGPFHYQTSIKRR
jgi:hypothetical protein